jgi:hypothetical protein
MDENSKFVFDHLSAKKKHVEKRLFINVIAQIITIIIGLSYVFKYDVFIGSITKEHFGIEGQIVKIVVPFILLYLFIEFGYAVSQFFYLSRFLKNEYGKIITQYCRTNTSFKQNDLVISFNSLNIFNQLLGQNSTLQGKFQTFLSRLIIAIIIVTNNFSIYITLELLISNKLILAILKIILTIILFIFYSQYISANAEHKYSPGFTTSTITILSSMVALYFFIDIIWPGIKVN